MKSFKTQSKRVLDLMINSIYTHKEIFLRELLSNCSDAIDKLYYKGLKEGLSGLTREDFYIKIRADKDAGTLTISDNGIGMTAKKRGRQGKGRRKRNRSVRRRVLFGVYGSRQG